MSRMKSVYTLTALALMISAASLANAQGSSSASTTAPATTAPATAAPAKPAAHHSSSHAAPKIDVNSASKEELMKLPGVGDATADKIIAGRPFKAKNDLVSKGIVTKAEYDKLASHIIAKTEPAKK